MGSEMCIRYRDNSVRISHSGNDYSDNSMRIADSGNDNSTNAADSATVFGDGAIVAASSLSSYVSGVSVSYGAGNEDGDQSMADNSLANNGSAFQNFAGMQALNQNTGAGSLQQASVSVAVSTRDVSF